MMNCALSVGLALADVIVDDHGHDDDDDLMR